MAIRSTGNALFYLFSVLAFAALVTLYGCLARRVVPGVVPEQGEQSFLLVTGQDGRVRRAYKTPSNRFTLAYTHSVQKTPVFEDFIIDSKGDIILQKTRYFSYGAGLPFDEPGVMTEKDGQFIYHFQRVFGQINVVLWNAYVNFRLIINNEEYPLLHDFPQGSKLTIKAGYRRGPHLRGVQAK